MSLSPLERIERRAGELRDDECWFADYAAGEHGYCYVQLSPGLRVGLHRVAWEAHNAEPIPEGMVILHSCDNPACFNPAHLSVGTQQENLQDAATKGRLSGPNELRSIAARKRKRDSKGLFI